MRLFRFVGMIGLIALVSAEAYAQCEAYWLDLGGKGREQHLTLPGGWPLAQFTRNFPYWNPARYDSNGRYVGPASKSELRWDQVLTPPSVEVLGCVGGHTVSAITYSAAYRVLLWDRGGTLHCPLAILDGDDSIVAGLAKPKVFVWQGTEILSQRIFYTGMGAHQDSLFFAVVKGALVHLRVDAEGFRRFLESNRITLSHRGGGFCEGTLVWENLAWQEDAPPDERTSKKVRAVYRVEGNRLVFDSAAIVSDKPSEDHCQQYPR